jgi:hypothetical protein
MESSYRLDLTVTVNPITIVSYDVTLGDTLPWSRTFEIIGDTTIGARGSQGCVTNSPIAASVRRELAVVGSEAGVHGRGAQDMLGPMDLNVTAAALSFVADSWSPCDSVCGPGYVGGRTQK